MGDSSYVRASFLGGEWSQLVQGRTDLPAYLTAMNVCLNGLPIEVGTWVRRPGLRWVAVTFGGRPARLISFAFQEQAPYHCEFTDSTLRYVAAEVSTIGMGLACTRDPQVVTAISTAKPAEVTTTTAHGWSTSAHVLFSNMGTALTPLQNREFLITVTSVTTFTIADQVTGEAVDGATLGFLPVGAIVQRVLIDHGSPYGPPGSTTTIEKIRRVQAETTAVFLHPKVQPYSISVTSPPDLSTNTFATFSALSPQALSDGPYLDQYKGTYITPSGTSGSITLTASGAAFVGFKANDVGRLVRVFSQPAAWNPATTYAAGDVVAVYVDTVNLPEVATYWQATGATTNNSPPLSSSVWKAVAGTSVARWGWAVITAYTSATQVTATVQGAGLLYTGVAYAWRMGAYGGDNGWPTCGVYTDGRLVLAGAIANRLDFSRSNQKFVFSPTEVDGSVTDSCGIAAVLDATDVNAIQWMAQHQQGLIAGSQAGEWIITAPNGGSITPTNRAARRVTRIGGANLEPVQAEHTILFVQKFARKVMEYFADVFSGKFSAPHLSFTWKHLTKGGIDEIAYQQELAPVLWARVKGKLVGCTYKRESLVSAQGPTFAGGHRHTHGGGRTITSISVGPSAGGNTDSLMMVTHDAISGLYNVELLTDIPDESAALTDAQYVDGAVAPSWVPFVATVAAPYGGMQLNGLWPLNGRTVTAWIGGLDCGDYQVIGGSISVPFGDGVSGGTAGGQLTASYVASIAAIPIWVGFSYTSDGQIVRPNAPAEAGSRAGPAFAKLRRSHRVGVQIEGAVTGGISVGTDFAKLYPLRFTTPGGTPYTLTQQKTGIERTRVADDYSFDSMLCWRITRPYPANVIAIGPALETADD